VGPRVIALLVGEIGAGKTTICRQVAALARERGLRPAGILSRPIYDEQGHKTSLVAVDLWSGQARRLASLQRPLSDLGRGPYSFCLATFAWANRAVLAALREAPDLIILDEIGPLELVAGVGFAPLIDPVAGSGRPALLVVRRECHAAVEARLPGRLLTFQVDGAARDALPARIVEALCGAREAAGPEPCEGYKTRQPADGLPGQAVLDWDSL
jgi:nucleoside-triphosphatase THEP1